MALLAGISGFAFAHNSIGFNLYVSGTGNIVCCFPTWKLFSYIGDPDEMNLYEFYKQKNDN
jgi:hypothetical protein